MKPNTKGRPRRPQAHNFLIENTFGKKGFTHISVKPQALQVRLTRRYVFVCLIFISRIQLLTYTQFHKRIYYFFCFSNLFPNYVVALHYVFGCNTTETSCRYTAVRHTSQITVRIKHNKKKK